MQSAIPRIVIAGTHSGCGKTTVVSGIMAALTAQGLRVQPFKVGPDFIDPSHHTRICGRISRNLDPWMMGEEGIKETFQRACEGADIAVVEGVMGLFDGVDGSDFASTAHVAKILCAPIILVLDAKGMSRSVHAIIDGFRKFDPLILISGVIFNRMGSSRHRQMIEASLSVPSFGWVPKREDLAVASRHLGLKMAHESDVMREFGKIIEEFCDLDAIMVIAGKAPHTTEIPLLETEQKFCSSIGVAFDDAFCFYYQDNLDRLRRCGAHLAFFSPLQDYLPDVDAVYFGGGYPELHLPVLESSPCRMDLKDAVDQGMPVYAECGGLMYLTREIENDRTYRMSGVFPAVSEMTSKIQALGYVKGEYIGERGFLRASQYICGHEFHYSRVIADSDAHYVFRLSRGKGVENGKDGIVINNAIGTYTHAYFSKEFAMAFIEAAKIFRNR